MRIVWKEAGLRAVDAKEEEDEAEELIADVHAQSEETDGRVEISTATPSEPQQSENVDPEQIESGSADGELMDHDELLSEDDYSEDPTDDDGSLEQRTENSSNDEFAGLELLEPLDGTVTYTRGTTDVSQHKHIGYWVGKLIRRSKMRNTFYDEMEEPSRDTCLLAFDLFDRYGCLRPEYKNHPIRKGSGIWKEELDDGDFLLIEEIKIDEEYRQRGLGSRVVNAMLDKTEEKTRGFFAITWPTVFCTDKLRHEVKDKTETEREIILKPYDKVAKAFWRSLGFRRIGSSYWFALASDPGHRCHSLPVSDDYDPEVPHHDTSKYPQALVTAMMEPDEARCAEKLAQFLHQTPIADPSWFMPDKKGNTLLHIAALNSQPRTVDWIMTNGFAEQMSVHVMMPETRLWKLLSWISSGRERLERSCFLLCLCRTNLRDTANRQSYALLDLKG